MVWKWPISKASALGSRAVRYQSVRRLLPGPGYPARRGRGLEALGDVVEQAFGLVQLALVGQDQLEIDGARHPESSRVDHPGVDVHPAGDAFPGQGLLQEVRGHLAQDVEQGPVRVPDSGDLVPELDPGVDFVVAVNESALGGRRRLHGRCARGLGCGLHPSEEVLHLGNHLLQGHPTHEDQRRVVHHEVGLVQIPLVLPTVFVEVGHVPLGPEHRMHHAGHGVHLLVVRRLGPVQITQALLDQDHPLFVELPEHGVGHAVGFDAEEQVDPLDGQVECRTSCTPVPS